MPNKIDMAHAWNKISKSYQERYQISTSHLHLGPLCSPKIGLSLLGNVQDKKVIEIGSGAGQNSIFLAKNGAITTAIDISTEQLDYGKSLAKKEKVNVSFICGDFEKIKTYFHRESFDIAFSVYALQYCSTLKSMNDTFKQIYEILNPDGIFVFSLDHPVRTIGYWEEKKDKFILDHYFDRSQKEWDYYFPETGISARMQGSFKTLSDIVNGIIKVGFKLEKLLEPEPIKKDTKTLFGSKSRYGKNNKKDPYSFNHLSRIPGTLIIKAVK